MSHAWVFSEKNFRWLLAFLFVAALVFNFVPIYLEWNQPLAGMHGFRQTQTAISVQYMAKGGPLLRYETPVMGAPWSIPFEFPVYQWCCLLVYRVLPVTLDQAGRLTSCTAFLLTIWPLWVIIKRLGGDLILFLMMGSMLLCSPTYAYWSKTFMIESTALLFSMTFLALLLVYLQKPRPWTLAAVVLAACLAALVKVTTYTAFLAAGSLLISRDCWQQFRQNSWRSLARRYAPLVAGLAVSVLAVAVWVKYSDSLKSQSPLGATLTSAALRGWNFGSWGQLFSLEFREIVSTRIIPDSLGVQGPILLGGILFFCGFVAGKPNSRTAALAAIMIALFALPIIVHTNLYRYHNYYQFANAIFLIGAVAVSIWWLYRAAPKWVAILGLAAVIACEVNTSSELFQAECARDKTTAHEYRIAQLIKNNTPDGTVIVGVGLDWSSVVPYYSERRAVLIPRAHVDRMVRVFDKSPTSVTGGLPVSAIVNQQYEGVVGETRQKVLIQKLKEQFAAGMRVEQVGSTQVLLRR
jgi:hypothetical protein